MEKPEVKNDCFYVSDPGDPISTIEIYEPKPAPEDFGYIKYMIIVSEP